MGKRNRTTRNRDPRSHTEPTGQEQVEKDLRELKKEVKSLREEVATLKAALAEKPAIEPGSGGMMTAGDGGNQQHPPDPD